MVIHFPSPPQTLPDRRAHTKHVPVAMETSVDFSCMRGEMSLTRGATGSAGNVTNRANQSPGLEQRGLELQLNAGSRSRQKENG